MKYLILILSCFVYCIQCTNKGLNNGILGDWQVVNFQSLLHVPLYSDEMVDQSNLLDSLCKKAKVSINDSLLIMNPAGACSLRKCYLAKKYKKQKYHVFNNDSLYFKYIGAEIVEYDVASRQFADKIGIKGNSIEYYDTGCLVDWGDFTLKIIIIDKENIVLFSGADLTFLKKLK